MRSERPGIAASLGIAVGPAHVIPRMGGASHHKARDASAEAERLRDAVEASRTEIETAKDAFAGGGETAFVLDAQLLMHRDDALLNAALRYVERDGVNAEWALEKAVDELKAPLEAAGSKYFRERALDIAHMGQHILRHLRGGLDRLDLPAGRVVIVATDLSPADAVRLLGDTRVCGLVTEVGSSTSHTALLARALEVPAVVGVGPVLDGIANGCDTIVDGLRGRVVLDPRDEELEDAEKRGRRFRRFASDLRKKSEEPAKSLDGVPIALMANIELPAEAMAARAHGAQGIGLYRTEFLFLDREDAPGEDEQVAVYRDVIDACGERPIVVRTLDLGGDKLPARWRVEAGPNPALGLRAVRLTLHRPELLRTQVRAVLRAAKHGTLDLMFPLVEGPDRMRELRAVVEDCREELVREGVEHEAVRVGAMVEVPSAALMCAELAREADFLSVGTNDLVQYTLAVDRGNADVARWADPLHPAVLRLLAMIVRGAGDTPLAMCGDMAADPIALPVVLGLGYRSFSVPAVSLPFAQELVRRVDVTELASLAEALLETTPDAPRARVAVAETLAPTLGTLWAEQGVS